MDVAASVSFTRQQRVAANVESLKSKFQLPTSITLRNPFAELFSSPQKKKTLAVIVSEYDPPKLKNAMAAQA
ncbi:hypothetical protein AAP_01418 [Ascosphaera apis ARSEF 7405]|uniref:Uncharacterized protein n=1 Tax=Ascosphaera apis ARSEF 7405 TaxID=392613 RepID=A0A162IL67_9EURO|nr:hypothetical protein AAP_01418 [Ascosphaera apis ARSEF 7405]